MSDLSEVLGRVFFLRDAEPAATEAMVAAAACHTYPKGNFLFHHGDPGTAIYIVVEGRVKISLFSSEGREVVLAVLREAGVFGLIAALHDGNNLGSASTLTTSRIAHVPRAHFDALLERFPHLHQSFSAELARLLREAYEKVGTQALLPVKKRLLAALLEIGRTDGKPNQENEIVFFRPTHKELAERIGTTRVVVARALKELHCEKRVISGQGKIIRLSMSALVEPTDF